MITHFRHIPEWDRRGFLPPWLGELGQAVSHPPYLVPLTDFVLRFGDTARRREILTGFLDYRNALHTAGLVRGFQWVNGSFVTNTAQIANRDPNDIDVVTFYHLPEGYTQETLLNTSPTTFDRTAVLAKYNADTDIICLDTSDMFYLLKVSVFWHSFWSHTIQGYRKGYLVIPLDNSMDASARMILDEQADMEGSQ